jgi:hypothetical protein
VKKVVQKYPHPETTIYQETRTTRTTFPKLLELEKNNDQQSTNTQPIAQPINQNPEIQPTEIITKEKFGETGAGGAGMPENQGFCGAGEASNGAGTGAGGAGIFVLPAKNIPNYQKGALRNQQGQEEEKQIEAIKQSLLLADIQAHQNLADEIDISHGLKEKKVIQRWVLESNHFSNEIKNIWRGC